MKRQYRNGYDPVDRQVCSSSSGYRRAESVIEQAHEKVSYAKLKGKEKGRALWDQKDIAVTAKANCESMM